jgi:hypothetical protein
MQKDKIRKQDLSGYLKLIYQAGFQHEHPQLFNIEDTPQKDRDTKEAVRFYKLIQEESNKRNMKALELIDYFTEHRKELLRLLEKGEISIKRFPTIYKHYEMERVTQEVFKTKRPRKTGRVDGNETWAGHNVQYLIPVEEHFRLKGENPKVHVSQLKNMSVLLAMVQEQQYNKKDKEPFCEFSKVEYARRRGRTEEQIKKGGKIFEEDRRDLITGAITTYKIDNIEINGKKYTRYGIPNYYLLDEPKDPRDNLRVSFLNEPHKTFVMAILNGKAKSYLQENPKAIEDRYTDQNPYLFLFYLQLVKRKQSGSLLWWRVKVKDVLADMGANKQVLDRPKKCFDMLKACLIYFSNHYQPVPEIQGFQFHKVSQNVKSDIEPLRLSVATGFKDCSYEEFKSLLKNKGIDDLREAYMCVERYPASFKKTYKLNDQETEILNRTLKWFDGKVTKIPLKDQKSQIAMYIKKLGYDTYKNLFEQEFDKWTNALDFLLKVLPHHLKNPREPVTRPAKEGVTRDDKLIEEILSWVYSHWAPKKPKEEVRDYLVRAKEKMGYDKLEHLFAVEGNKSRPNGIEFLFKVLPQYVKDPDKPITGSRPPKLKYVN